MIYNVYCDESCHLENDGINVMVIGAVFCPQDKLKKINKRISDIKMRNGVRGNAEIKWTKVSPVKKQLYSDIIDYFFDESDFHYRCLVIPDKNKLCHSKFNQTHDDWYYKMYFTMLKTIFKPNNTYEVYIDIKDDYSYQKSQKLHEVCCNDKYDFSKKIIKRIQPIRSSEIQIMQIVDVLTGAVASQNRKFDADFIKSKTKSGIISRISEYSHYSLTKSTLLGEDKFNIFVWDAEVN
jgi:hypothetical protein